MDSFRSCKQPLLQQKDWNLTHFLIHGIFTGLAFLSFPFMANLYSELEHNQFKHHILARWIKNNKNKFNILFPINKTFLKNYDKRQKQALDSYICTFLCFFNQQVHWRILWIIQEKSMHVYLIQTIYRTVENCRNDLSFILEAHIFWMRMSKLSSFASVDFDPWCRATMINQSPERKQSFSTTTFSYLPEMWYHADLLTASPGDHD